MIKRSFVLLLAGLALFVSAGCFQVNLDTAIEKDGSGTTDIEISVIESLSVAVAELQKMGGSLDEVDIVRIMSLEEEALKDGLKGHDVKVQSFKSETVDGRKTLSIGLEFKDLENMAFAIGRITGKNDGSGLGIFSTEDGNLVLKDATYAFADEPAEEVDESMDMPSDEILDKQMDVSGLVMQSQGEFKMVNVITVPGDVLETTATRADGRTCTWTVDMETLMSDREALKPRVVFSGNGLKIQPMQE